MERSLARIRQREAGRDWQRAAEGVEQQEILLVSASTSSSSSSRASAEGSGVAAEAAEPARWVAGPSGDGVRGERERERESGERECGEEREGGRWWNLGQGDHF